MKCIAKSIFDFDKLLIHTPLINNAVLTSVLHSSLFRNPCFHLFVNALLFFFNKFDHYGIEVALLYMFFFGVLAFDKTVLGFVKCAKVFSPSQTWFHTSCTKQYFLAKVLMFSQKIMKSEFLANMHIYISAFLSLLSQKSTDFPLFR